MMKHVLARTYEITRQGQTYALGARGWLDENGEHVGVELHDRLSALLLVTLNAEDVFIDDRQELLDRARDARLLAHFGRAERLCRRFLRGEPDHDGALAVFCSVLRSRRRPSEAITLTDHRRETEYVPLVTSRAAAFCDLKRWSKALETIRRVPDHAVDDEVAAVFARIERMTGPPSEMFRPQVAFLA